MIATWWLASALIILGHFKHTFSHKLHDTSHYSDACACSSVNAVGSIPFWLLVKGLCTVGCNIFFAHSAHF